MKKKIVHKPCISLHSHNTRFSKIINFLTQRPRKKFGLNSFRNLGPKFWFSDSKIKK